MASHNLPLLHKYVFNNDDDLKLKMSKLQYRLCVQEVSHVILGKHMAVGDFEPSIVPEYDMTSVEAHPPRMEDFPNADEGLSSPESEDYPHKQQHDYPYNDSGILSDESTLNNRTQSEDANDDYDDNLSDVSDPNDYHISIQDHDDMCNDTQVNPDDSAVVMNGSATLSDNELEIVEDTIEAEVSTRQDADISLNGFAEPTESELESLKITDTLSAGESDDNTHAESPRAVTPVITVTDTELRTHLESDADEVIEQVILRSEVKAVEELTEVDDDVERVDFVSGQRCNDVDTALQVLKTRYRLSTSTLKKCIITSPDNKNKRYSAPVFSYEISKWNLQDIVRCPDDNNDCWKPKVIPVEEKQNVYVITDTINRRDTEIADLLKKVLEEDRKRREAEERRRAPPEPEIVELKEPHLEAIPETDAENQDTPGKKKKGNIFQRMMRALRKRLSGNRHRA